MVRILIQNVVALQTMGLSCRSIWSFVHQNNLYAKVHHSISATILKFKLVPLYFNGIDKLECSNSYVHSAAILERRKKSQQLLIAVCNI